MFDTLPHTLISRQAQRQQIIQIINTSATIGTLCIQQGCITLTENITKIINYIWRICTTHNEVDDMRYGK